MKKGVMKYPGNAILFDKARHSLSLDFIMK